MYRLVLFLSCAVVSVTSNYNSDYSSLYDSPTSDDYPDLEDHFDSYSEPPRRTSRPKVTTVQQTTSSPVTTSTAPAGTTTFRPTPPRIDSEFSDVPPLAMLISRIGTETNEIQQRHMNELQCLKVLDNLITSQWQEDINGISVQDLGNFSTLIKVPEFQSLYSNPESEWVQGEEMALNKIDKCTRNLVSKTAPRMNEEEINCLNRMYQDYLMRERNTTQMTAMYISETSREQLPFKSFYTYFEMTELLFDNKNIDALDGELRAVHEDMLEFYIKTEEDKSKRIFILEQECEWKNARFLREASSEADRYQKFGQLVKSLVNRYLVSEILHKWVPGAIVSAERYDLYSESRRTMDREILDKISELQSQKRDAQYLCTYAAQFATKFFEAQKTILLDDMKNAPLSFDLKTHEKYSYVVALKELLLEKTDDRLSRVEILIKEFKEGHYCLTSFVRMIEHQMRYAIASEIVNEMLPYGITYCQVKEMSAELVNPRYCKCQGTFCEEFGLATLRAERFQLNLLPNGTYTVITDPSYRILPLDELISMANQRIAQQKFNTWWYRNQKKPAA